MTMLKTAAAILALALTAACIPMESERYTQAPKPQAGSVDYPMIAATAVADGQVYEYH